MDNQPMTERKTTAIDSINQTLLDQIERLERNINIIDKRLNYAYRQPATEKPVGKSEIAPPPRDTNPTPIEKLQNHSTNLIDLNGRIESSIRHLEEIL